MMLKLSIGMRNQNLNFQLDYVREMDERLSILKDFEIIISNTHNFKRHIKKCK